LNLKRQKTRNRLRSKGYGTRPHALLLDRAAENGYGIPAFNVNNMEQIQAIMQAAAATNSPVILQASRGARKYAGENFLRHLITAAVET
jgi:fructose-bisphosphate aldolase class II